MKTLRRNRKSAAEFCLAIWLFAFAIGVAGGCNLLPAAHAFDMSQSPISQDQTDDGDEHVGCGISCVDGLPLSAPLAWVQGLFSAHALIVQTWTDTLSPLPWVRAEAARNSGVYHSGVPPRLRYLRLTL